MDLQKPQQLKEQISMNSLIFNIDFDGTCTTHDFPNIGKEIGAVPVLRKLVEKGHQLILFTMRCDHEDQPTGNDPSIEYIKGNFLTGAVNWFERHTIPLYGVQCNPTQHSWTKSPKSYAHLMIDDSAIGTPLLKIPEISKRPFVNWFHVAGLLSREGIFTWKEASDTQEEIKVFFEEHYNIEL